MLSGFLLINLVNKDEVFYFYIPLKQGVQGNFFFVLHLFGVSSKLHECSSIFFEILLHFLLLLMTYVSYLMKQGNNF